MHLKRELLLSYDPPGSEVGSCQFDAVLHQLNQLDHINIINHKSSLTSHKELRKLFIQYLTDNPYVPDITSAQQIHMRNFVNDNNFDKYLKLMALPTTFGDNITI